MLKRTFLAVAIAFVLAIPFAVPSQTNAQSASQRTVAVIPPSFELYANPGESISDKLRVRNDSSAVTQYSIMVEDFRAVGEEGQVDLVNDDQANTTFSAAKWVVPSPKSFSLQPGGEIEIPFTINVPVDAEPGGHYCSILVKIGGAEVVEGGGAAVSSRVGSLILLRVSGNIKEEAIVESFSADKSYYQSSPVNFDLRVKDLGSNHIKPKGTIVITNLFGQKITELPLNGLNVLPGAVRKMTTKWEFSAPLANRFTATLVATYGQQNKPLSATDSFTIFPKYLAIVAGAALLVILLLIVGRKKVKKILHNLTK